MDSRFVNTFLAVFIAAILAGCSSSTTPTPVPKASSPSVPTPTQAATISGVGADTGVGLSAEMPQTSSEEVAIIETEFGNIVFEFYSDVAPINVKNFKDLAASGFYNGTTFHRVIPFFMIQGGDPLTKDDDRSNDGTGGPGYTIKAEFSQIPHERGIVSMARRGDDPDSAGSQFFITVKYSDRSMKNDGSYTVFGKVTEGMDVVDEIVAASRDFRDNPFSPVKVNVHIEKR